MPENNDSRWPTRLGIVEWFQTGEYERVEQVLEQIRALGCTQLRTGFSWADYHCPEGPEWYDWLIPRLSREVELLPCFTYTPPSIALEPNVNAPPRDNQAYADFIDEALTRYGRHFEYVELWNEPNNQADWNFRLDPNWVRFSDMVGRAAYWAKHRGWKTVLGGMSPFDSSFLALLGSRELLKHIDVVGIHGFPGTWDHDWPGWGELVEQGREGFRLFNPEGRIWITEAGYSNIRQDEITQMESFLELVDAPVERAYWYAAHDLDPARPHQGGGMHCDERHYHMGMCRHGGEPKLIYRMLEANGVGGTRRYLKRLQTPVEVTHESGPPSLICGGAGFIGTNVARRLLRDGGMVRVFDNLSRPGVEQNLQALLEDYPGQVDVRVGDMRNPHALADAVKDVRQVFHFAAQVAVTTSLDNPQEDFAINAQGTLNLLEALRAYSREVPLLFTSTNKVYGNLEDLDLEKSGDRYQPRGSQLRGIDESRPLDFHSPYGCSKGAADQYVLDWGRSYGMPTTVFRMSCIYGPHQWGNEDQGWVAHFVRAALAGEPITIYGNGLQVRDVLYVEDLAEAMLRAQELAPDHPAQAYNMGGGPERAVSLLQVIALLRELLEEPVQLDFGAWRTGDQRYYVSDTRRFQDASGWRAKVAVREGLSRMLDWMRGHSARAPIRQQVSIPHS